MVKSVCGYTNFCQTDNNLLPSMEQQQVKLESKVAYPMQASELGPLLFLIYISNINNIITDSTVSCFAYDTRNPLGIKDEEEKNLFFIQMSYVYPQMLQNYLLKLSIWADTNNMNVNTNKLEPQRYGEEQEIKTATITYHMTIQILTAKNKSEIWA